MPRVNGKVSAPIFTDGNAAMGTGSLMLSSSNTEKHEAFREARARKKQNKLLRQLLPPLAHPLPAAQEWLYTLVCHETPNLTAQVPRGPLA